MLPGPNPCRRSPPSCVLTATRSTSSPTAAPPSASSASSSPYCPPLTSAFAPGSASRACPRPSCLCRPNHASWRSPRASDDPQRLLVPTFPHFQIQKKQTKKQKHWKQYNAFSMPAKLSDVLILSKSSSHCLSSDNSTSNLQPAVGYLQLTFHCFLSPLSSG